MQKWPLLEARVLEASRQQLRLCNVTGYGRCLEAQVPCARGQLLAEEKALVLGSSDGTWLAKVCCVGEAAFDAMDDLIAGCLLCHADLVEGLAKELSRESNMPYDPCSDQLLQSLSPDVCQSLGPASTAILQQWRACCDVNAETWVELKEQLAKQPLLRHVRFLFGLFAALAMVEHSCRPNARVEWDSTTETMKLIAVEDISSQDRISRSYLDVGPLMLPTHVRRQLLKHDWGFDCACSRCKSSFEEPNCEDFAKPFIFDGDVTSQTDGRGHLSLQKCADPTGLKLDARALEAIRQAGTACASLQIPPVGTLHFLESFVADLQAQGNLTSVTLCLTGVQLEGGEPNMSKRQCVCNEKDDMCRN